MSGVITVCSVPARAALVPQPSCATSGITAGRPGTPQDSEPRGTEKNSSKWEGPFRVTHTLRPRAVYLEDEKGTPQGNAENLWKFYP